MLNIVGPKIMGGAEKLWKGFSPDLLLLRPW